MIIDTFMFNGEFSSLKIRLTELYSTVDLFIICESKYTHSGIKKDKLFISDSELINEFKQKILVIIDHRRHFTPFAPIREMLQRQVISGTIKNLALKGHNLIIHSDCDEIPRASVIQSLLKIGSECNVLLEMNNYVNYLNVYAGKWSRARVISSAKYKSIQNMRQDIFLLQAFNNRRHRMPFIRVPNYWTSRRFLLWKFPKFILRKPQIEIVKNAGWHFNNLLKAESVLTKIENSSHTELNTHEVRLNAKNRFLNGQDVYTGEQYATIDIDSSYPKTVYERLNEWRDHIRN